MKPNIDLQSEQSRFKSHNPTLGRLYHTNTNIQAQVVWWQKLKALQAVAWSGHSKHSWAVVIRQQRHQGCRYLNWDPSRLKSTSVYSRNCECSGLSTSARGPTPALDSFYTDAGIETPREVERSFLMLRWQWPGVAALDNKAQCETRKDLQNGTGFPQNGLISQRDQESVG